MKKTNRDKYTCFAFSSCRMRFEGPRRGTDDSRVPQGNGTGGEKTEPETEKTGEVTWTKFSAMDLDENEVTSVLGDNPSKLTMVYIWGTYCPSCVASLPELANSDGVRCGGF